MYFLRFPYSYFILSTNNFANANKTGILIRNGWLWLVLSMSTALFSLMLIEG